MLRGRVQCGLLLIGLSACADKAPPARFRDPPPPTLAQPLTPDQLDRSSTGETSSESSEAEATNDDGAPSEPSDPSEPPPSER